MRTAPILSLALLLTGPAWPAQPSVAPVTVIHDAGGVPLAPYLGNDEAGAPEAAQPPRPLIPQSSVTIFPVTSTRAGPGRLLRNPMPARLPGGPGHAFFVVGDDPPSHDWLRRNAEHLHRLGASGIVAAVATEANFLRLRAMVGLPLVPMSADALLEAAGIHVWPVVVGADGSISQ